ncbi:MAG: winged helix-turn-helix domain-containing protein [Magnetococcales bacterium]|nr:winged helix-turn-helix domain-containing protein [Magnetococcales bacterium]
MRIIPQEEGDAQMARKPSGLEVVGRAKEYLTKAKTVAELRQAQAVVLPIEFGMSMAQTAQILGVSVGWVCRLRTRFIREGGRSSPVGAGRGGRRRENMSREEEAEFLEPFFDKAKAGGVLVVEEIKRALDECLGRKVALSSVYNLLHRHGWRKLTPDKRHPQSDPEAQADWKKNCPKSLPKSIGSGRRKGRSG